MPSEDVWLHLAQECPRRILAALHRNGTYRHGTTARFPGKILCCHQDTPLPEDWKPTPAQEQAKKSSAQPLPRQEVPGGQVRGGSDPGVGGNAVSA